MFFAVFLSFFDFQIDHRLRTTTFRPLFASTYPAKLTKRFQMNNDCIEVDELIEIADYKNDLADMAAEKLLRKCSTSWEAYQYLRVHQSREFGGAYEL